MALVSDLFEQRWLHGSSGTRPPAHVGTAKPTIRVALRRGKFRRGFFSWDGEGDFANIPGESEGHPWRARWEPLADYTDIPGVLEVDLEQDFEGNGQTRATINVENVVMVEKTGLAGLFRTIERGYMSPWRGYSHDSQHFPVDAAGTKNAWFNRLARDVQITIWAGYGDDTMVKMWTGMLDDTDLTSKPSKIVIAARDFGQVLTDQHIFGKINGTHVLDPCIFADRRRAFNRQMVGGAAKASSHLPGRPASIVLDGNRSTTWISERRSGPNLTEWVEIHVPHGSYEQFMLDTPFSGMECYVSVYVRNKDIKNRSVYVDGDGGHHKNPAKLDGQPIPNGWLDVGKGDVPGETNGGVPYIKRIRQTDNATRDYSLPKLEIGTNSVIRLSFRRLRRWKGTGSYHAGVHRFKAVKSKLKAEAKRKKWILVDDITDVVKVLLRWGGFEEWEVETAGVRLKEPFVINRANFLNDPIKKISEQTGFVFFMADPTTADSSIGVPVFRHNSIFGDPTDTRVVQDTDLLTGVQAKFTDEPLGHPIRVRGKLLSRKKGGRGFSGEPARIAGDYWPPWYSRLGGLLKHTIHYDAKLKTVDECKMACFLIALAQAMKSATAVIELPANPGVELDEQIALRDTGTGLATRLYIASRSMNFRTGENAQWRMTVGGSLIDTPDVVEVLKDLFSYKWGRDEDVPKIVQLHNPEVTDVYG